MSRAEVSRAGSASARQRRPKPTENFAGRPRLSRPKPTPFFFAKFDRLCRPALYYVLHYVLRVVLFCSFVWYQHEKRHSRYH